MNRLSLGVRFAGSPLGALVVLLACGGVVAGWYQGQLSWWLMFFALLVALRTVKAIAQVRRFKVWRGEWEAMQEPGAGREVRSAKKRRGVRRWHVALALAAFVALPLLAPAGPGREAFAQLWAADCLFVASVAAVFVARLLLRRGRVKVLDGDAEAARRAEADRRRPVAWMMGRASSSPSRAEAASNLPGYCAGLLKGVGGQG
jgi:hypothetical protein